MPHLPCDACVYAENHAKDVTLWKAVQAKFGGSIPKTSCLKFVKTCPGCILQQNRPAEVAGFKPILTAGFRKRGQVSERTQGRAGTHELTEAYVSSHKLL